MTDTTDRSMGELAQRLSEQASTLVRQELQLAQVEMQQKGKRAAVGAGAFGAAGIVALFAVGAVVTAAIAALATTLDTWLAALIVGVVLFAAAGVAALLGRREISEATPPAPEQAMESTRADVQTIKEAAHR